MSMPPRRGPRRSTRPRSARSTAPRAIAVVLLDSTDEIPDIAKREIRTVLLDMAETLPVYGSWRSGCSTRRRPAAGSIFAKCNPGDGSGAQRIHRQSAAGRQRWLDGFRQPLDEALDAGFQPLPGKTSPIMETIQRIAVERFTGRAVERRPQIARRSSPTCCSTGRLFAIQAAISRSAASRLARLQEGADRPARRRGHHLLHPAADRQADQFRRPHPLLGGLDPRQQWPAEAGDKLQGVG